MDPNLANLLVSIAGQVMFAATQHAGAAVMAESPIAKAVTQSAADCADIEVTQALEAWVQSEPFRQYLAALNEGQQDFDNEELVRSFTEASGFYYAKETRAHAEAVLATFSRALEEELLKGELAVLIHDRRERLANDQLSGQIADLARKIDARGDQSSVAGWWVRFESYQFDEGWIVPTPGAELNAYDPWALSDEAKTRAYQELSSLSDRMRGASDTIVTSGGRFAYELPGEIGEDVLDWCARYGLLGVLLTLVHSVILPPRWTDGGKLFEHMYGSKEAAPLYPSIRVFSRTNGGWLEGGHSYPFLDEDVEERRHHQNGALVDPQKWHASWPRPGTIVRSATGGELGHEPLTATWARYFPSVAEEDCETYDYPLPLSEPFWHAYGERVEDFMNGAFRLATALEGIERGHLRPLDRLVDGKPEDLWFFNHARSTLHGLIEPVSAVLLRTADGELSRRWTCPSLLSSLAMMAFLDLTQD